MSTNPLLAKLGLSSNDRAVIFHADDIGMCHAAQMAYEELIAVGSISSAATMVPCGWYPATAVYCRENQANQPHIDMGVHVTLTSEWVGTYRWGPISTRERSSGLMDEQGYFYAETVPAQENMEPDAVKIEIEAQIHRALADGIDVTHIDSHMGSIFHAKFLPAYFDLAQKYQIPALAIRPDAIQGSWGEPDGSPEMLAEWQELEDNGFPMLDCIEGMSLDQPKNRIEEAKQRLYGLPPGVSYFIIHPSIDTAELRTIAPDWENRVADYELFRSDEWQKTVEESGVKVIGWRVLRDLMRAA